MTDPPSEVGDGSAPPQEESDEDGGGSPPMLEEVKRQHTVLVESAQSQNRNVCS
jgi:hypothetical protein